MTTLSSQPQPDDEPDRRGGATAHPGANPPPRTRSRRAEQVWGCISENSADSSGADRINALFSPGDEPSESPRNSAVCSADWIRDDTLPPGESAREGGTWTPECSCVLGGAMLLRSERELATQDWTFWKLFEVSLLRRTGRRERTLQEISQYVRRMLRTRPWWRNMPVSQITSADCARLIEESFATMPMRRKARSIMHGIFSCAIKLGLRAINPVNCFTYIILPEKPIRALTIVEVRQLLRTAQKKEFISCAPAIGLMLWAGLRPTEVSRIRWGDIRISDKTILVEAQNAKTATKRQVRMRQVLRAWLLRTAPYRPAGAPVVPRGWEKRWRTLRRAAGFNEWKPDILRHTFASYHLKYFRDLTGLQVDMGHSSVQLLRTRYLGMDNITERNAEEFWGNERPAQQSSASASN